MGFWVFKYKVSVPDVWMRPDTQQDLILVYEYVLLYTDNFLVVSENVESILKEEICRYFELKPYSIGPPSLYLGGYLWEVTLDNGIKDWAFEYTHYIQDNVKNTE